ncbi:hypothetical protein ACFYYB_35390 [Streptomyces sp. NPDC002886]|uniref:hypothetical protein n=1 Tax=Streptomyces sp. NPDC002886 TaxID=3364667 RepID=UPI00367D9578
MHRTRNIVNRIVLLGGGCLLLGAAAAMIASDTGALPNGWAGVGADVHWINPDSGTRGSSHSIREAAWAPLVLLTALTALGLLSLQLRRRILKRLPLNSPNCTVEGRAVTTAVAGRLLALPGVTSARISLHGPPGRASLRTRLVVDDTASPGQLLTSLSTTVLPEVRSFLAPHTVAVRARITVRGHHRPR